MTTNKSVDFDRFLKQLISATARVDSQYFNFRVADVNNTIFRERVYCYELYHQLRCSLENILPPYKLQAEVDKKANPTIPLELKKTKPDFIFHVPGTKNNLVVIEVKSINNNENKIKEDIEKLKKFLDYTYYGAMMLIYGDNKNSKNKINRVRTEIHSLSTRYSEHILLLWHKEPGKPAEVINHA